VTSQPAILTYDQQQYGTQTQLHAMVSIWQSFFTPQQSVQFFPTNKICPHTLQPPHFLRLNLILHFWTTHYENSYSVLTSANKETGAAHADEKWKWCSSKTERERVKFGALRKMSAHLPSLSLLVGHIRVLFAIVTVNAVHGRPVAVHSLKQSLRLLRFQTPIKNLSRDASLNRGVKV